MEATDAELGVLFESVMPHLNEVQRRLVAGAVARSLGHGGKSRVAAASGLSRNTVIKGQAEVEAGIEPSDRIRAPGAGTRRRSTSSPGCSRRSMSWSTRTRGGTRCRRCGGR